MLKNKTASTKEQLFGNMTSTNFGHHDRMNILYKFLA